MLSPIVLLFTLVACMADEAPQVAPEMVRKLISTPVDPKTLAAPIILIHGYVGSKAYVQGRNVTFPPHLSHCAKNWDFQKAWISPLLAMNFDSRLTDPPQACLLHMLSLKYDPAKKQFEEQQNVDVTFLGEDQFGSVMPMSCLLFETRVGCGFSAGAKLDESSFMPVVDFLEAEHGYKQGVNLFGASYDWRRTANMPEMDAYFANLTKLVEHAVETTGKKAFLVTHSMGNLIANYYLNHRVNEKWQKKYLNGTINVSAPWGGSMVVLEQLLRGNMNRLQMGGSLMIKDSTIRDFVSSLASSAVLVPSNLAFPAEQTLIMVNGTKYGTKEMDEILKMAGVPQFSPIYHELNEHVEAQKHTPMYCVHSIFGNNTPIAYNYPAGYKPEDHPEVTLGLGDNMVNLESLRVCNKWQEQGKLVKSVTEIQGPSHMGILHDDNFYRAIETIVGLQKIRG